MAWDRPHDLRCKRHERQIPDLQSLRDRVRGAMTPGAGAHKTEIVLVGGGHAHLYVLRDFALAPPAGVRLTLVSRERAATYSGMLPGVIAGLYRREEAQIDLGCLAAAADARLIEGEAVGLDRVGKRVVLAGAPAVAYDIVSLDVGLAPALDAIEGAAAHGIAAKPIGTLIERLDGLWEACRRGEGQRRIAVVGGGAGGVELMLSLRARLLAEAGPEMAKDFSFTLIAGDGLLPTHHRRVGTIFRRIFRARGIHLVEHRRALQLTGDAVLLDDGTLLGADAVVIATGGAAPGWFGGTGLARDAKGFLAVLPTLQVMNDPDVFAAGDCAALIETPREKAGVYAVRAGAPLARNLRARARGEAPAPWRPQSGHLALISTGQRHAVASRGPVVIEGAWVWRMKDWIDRRWVRRFQALQRPAAPRAL